jgi:C1A family cysteine protease
MPRKPSSRRRPAQDREGSFSLDVLQAEISRSGQTWQAAPTPLSQLPPSEQQAHLGLIVNEAELAAMEKAVRAASALEAFRAVAAPPAVDWRNNGGDWITPIRDQASCGSCVSFATLATIEARHNIACQNPNLDPDYSEAHLFYCGCGNCCANGWNFAPALDFCKNTGVALETAFPYVPGNRPCPPNLASAIKITAWTQVLAVADRKNILATKGPVVGGLAIYQDFYSYSSGVYRHVTGALVGYHAISVVGYDDAQSCWICKNSWGQGFGEQGFFRIGYGECQIDTSFAFYDVDVRCAVPPQPVDPCAQYVAALRQVLAAARTNTHLRACLRYYVCRRGSLPWWCPPQYRTLAQQVAQVLARCPAYRTSFCRALG